MVMMGMRLNIARSILMMTVASIVTMTTLHMSLFGV